MANQTGTLICMGDRSGQRAIPITLVDSDGGAATFPELGGASVFSVDENLRIIDFIGDGTTAPTTALRFQFKVGGNDRSKYINGANAFDPKSSRLGRLGAAADAIIPQGTNLQITGRA